MLAPLRNWPIMFLGDCSRSIQGSRDRVLIQFTSFRFLSIESAVNSLPEVKAGKDATNEALFEAFNGKFSWATSPANIGKIWRVASLPRVCVLSEFLAFESRDFC